jgi:propionyl-CoA carboxylase alpha chain
VESLPEGCRIRDRAARGKVLVLTALGGAARTPAAQAPDSSKMVLSPMPGLAVTLDVAVSQLVRTGEAVAIIEAMKMQNIIRAERGGTVKAVNVKAGDSVAADEVLVEFA